MDDNEASKQGTALDAHLAANDAPCEGCGYNLRGVVGGLCPECGRRNSLHELTRQTPPPSVLCLIALPVLSFVLAATAWSYGKEAWDASGFASATAQGSRGNVRVVVSSPQSWSNVPWTAWLGLGYFGVLALAGAAGVVVMYSHRLALPAASWKRLHWLTALLVCAFIAAGIVIRLG